MKTLPLLQNEMNQDYAPFADRAYVLLARGFNSNLNQPFPIMRGHALASLFGNCPAHIYRYDLIAGSLKSRFAPKGEFTEHEANVAWQQVASFGINNFHTNVDHFAPDYALFLQDGIPGTLQKMEASLAHWENEKDKKRVQFLRGALLAMQGFSCLVENYAVSAHNNAQKEAEPQIRANQMEIEKTCRALLQGPPATFRQALQLIWLTYQAFLLENRYAMAFGRLDQFLYPFYKNDLESNQITREQALELLECTLYKIGEMRQFQGHDDVANIAIGGLLPNGEGGVNEVSYLLLEAVKNCNIPGPNLSARLYPEVPAAFVDACLQVIGTGLGYPALMNDAVNIPALARHGYAKEDSVNYCMVGCIENFIQGKQPPWSDARYNTPKYLELAMNNGVCMLTGLQMGPQTGQPESFANMSQFMAAMQKQMEHGADAYITYFNNENNRYNREQYCQPFLSCFCQDCIARGLDINDGGALYPSVHGAACMGIATVADALAAMEQVIFINKQADMRTLQKAMQNDFAGYEDFQALLLKAPKYGNNDEFVDKYARWYVEIHDAIFSRYKTRDGGAIYVGIASNVSNIYAGLEVAATPDGRKAGQPMSDAASPMHGQDKNGPTAAVLSVSKPDYTKVSCGTVLNQKFTPDMFSNPVKRAKLAALVKVYFERGGQEMQVNAVSRDVLKDAMDNPDKYPSLVVRVSGFSAYYVTLDKAVQKDILERTEHG